MNRRMIWIISLVLSLMQGFPCAFGDVQLNTTVAAVKGQAIRIPCKNVNTYEKIHWYYYSLNNQKPTIVYNGKEMSQQFAKRFSLDVRNPGQRDLIVNYTKITDAGTYECLRHIPSPDRPDRMKPVVVNATQLTVMDNSPRCSYNTNSSTITEGYVVESDSISLTCSLNYSGSSRPAMKWLRKGHEKSLSGTYHLFSISTNYSLREATSNILVHVGEAEKILLYTCMASFSTAQYPESATSFSEVPDYHLQCNLTLFVAYGVRNVTISPIKYQYLPGDQLRCNAEGTPTPTYDWSQLGTSRVSLGPLLNLDETMAGEHEYTFQCKASNTVDGETKSMATHIKFTVLGRSWYSGVPMAGALGGVGFLAITISVLLLQRFLRSKCRKESLVATEDNRENSDQVNASSLPSSRDYESINENIGPAIITESTAAHQLYYSASESYFPLVARPPVELPVAYSHLETPSNNPAEEGGDLTDPVTEAVRANPYYVNVPIN